MGLSLSPITSHLGNLSLQPFYLGPLPGYLLPQRATLGPGPGAAAGVVYPGRWEGRGCTMGVGYQGGRYQGGGYPGVGLGPRQGPRGCGLLGGMVNVVWPLSPWGPRDEQSGRR